MQAKEYAEKGRQTCCSSHETDQGCGSDYRRVRPTVGESGSYQTGLASTTTSGACPIWEAEDGIEGNHTRGAARRINPLNPTENRGYIGSSVGAGL
jgi:hypothetical protein